MSDILEGVDEMTSPAELLARLRKAAGLLHREEDKRVQRLQEIQERVRRDWAGAEQDQLQVVSTASHPEWEQAVRFLANFDDLLPVALLRIYDGVKGELEKQGKPF